MQKRVRTTQLCTKTNYNNIDKDILLRKGLNTQILAYVLLYVMKRRKNIFPVLNPSVSFYPELLLPSSSSAHVSMLSRELFYFHKCTIKHHADWKECKPKGKLGSPFIMIVHLVSQSNVLKLFSMESDLFFFYWTLNHSTKKTKNHKMLVSQRSLNFYHITEE